MVSFDGISPASMVAEIRSSRFSQCSCGAILSFRRCVASFAEYRNSVSSTIHGVLPSVSKSSKDGDIPSLTGRLRLSYSTEISLRASSNEIPNCWCEIAAPRLETY